MTVALRYIAVIQARMGSRRLPGKVVKAMNGKPMLQRIFDQVSSSKLLANTVVATSEQPENGVVTELCEQIGAPVYIGSETDVLDRMISAAEAEKADVMVRLTGDNPLVTGDLVDLVLAKFEAGSDQYDYVHTLGMSGWPHGMAVEAVRMSALRAALQSSDPMDREHVTFFVRNRPQAFSHIQVDCPEPCGDQSVTVDTSEEFERVQTLFRNLEKNDIPATYQNILMTLRSSLGAIR